MTIVKTTIGDSIPPLPSARHMPEWMNTVLKLQAGEVCCFECESEAAALKLNIALRTSVLYRRSPKFSGWEVKVARRGTKVYVQCLSRPTSTATSDEANQLAP